MRRAITVISFMLSGASVLIFILALLIPELREAGITEVDKASGFLKKTITALELEQSQSPAEATQNPSHGLPASSQPLGGSPRVAPNETVMAQYQGESGIVQSLPSPPETTVLQSNEKSTGPAQPVDAEENGAAQNNPVSLLVLGEGVFPPGEIIPNVNAQAAIDNIIPMINARPQDKVVVEGHADKWLPGGVSPAQASKWNQVISFLRADAVAKVLKKKGVDSDRIIVQGVGDAVPIASNHTRSGRAKNRRVEIKFSAAQ